MAKNANIEQRIFPELEGEQLRRALESSAAKTEIAVVERPLTVQQIQKFNERQAVISEREMVIEDEIKNFCDPLKAEIKDMKGERRSIAKTTKKGLIDSEEQVYWIADQDNKRMLQYGSDGELISSRRMAKEERQVNIPDMGEAVRMQKAG